MGKRWKYSKHPAESQCDSDNKTVLDWPQLYEMTHMHQMTINQGMLEGCLKGINMVYSSLYIKRYIIPYSVVISVLTVALDTALGPNVCDLSRVNTDSQRFSISDVTYLDLCAICENMIDEILSSKITRRIAGLRPEIFPFRRLGYNFSWSSELKLGLADVIENSLKVAFWLADDQPCLKSPKELWETWNVLVMRDRKDWIFHTMRESRNVQESTLPRHVCRRFLQGIISDFI